MKPTKVVEPKNPKGRPVVITGYTVDDDPDEDVFVSIEVEGRESVEWYMQSHEAAALIRAIAAGLQGALEKERSK